MIRAGIIGATGYAGGELVRILTGHKDVEIKWYGSRSYIAVSYTHLDDETFDQADFLRRVAASPNCPKSSCPSPQRYMEAYTCEADRVYVVTLSAELSGSYNSAELGKKLYEEERGAKNIHVFNSCSASVGQTLIAMKIEEYEKAGLPFEEVVACLLYTSRCV